MASKKRGRPQKSKLTPARIQSLSRDREALQMRLEGQTFEEIAEKLHYLHRGHAYAGVTRALKESLREPADKLRELEGQRIDRVWKRLMRDLDVEDLETLPQITNALMRVAERRAKLFGLDAPEKIDLFDRTKILIVEEDDWRGVPKPD